MWSIFYDVREGGMYVCEKRGKEAMEGVQLPLLRPDDDAEAFFHTLLIYGSVLRRGS
jgi:hypothetical protein